MADPTPPLPPPPAYIEISEDEEEMQEHQVAELPIDDEREDEHDLQEEQGPEIPINDDAIAREGEGHEYESDDDDDDEGAEIDPDYAFFLAQQFASGFPHGAFHDSGGTGSRAEAVEGGEKRRRIEGPSTSTADGVGSSRGSELNQSEIDGLFCPICLEAWTTDGTHRICCLPCGHIYGMTCIAIWVLRKGKCPQCNQKCKLKEVRRLYASQLVSVDEQSQKRIRALEDKCAALEEKVAGCYKKEAEWLNREAVLTLKVEELTKHREGSQLEDLPVLNSDIPVPNSYSEPHGMATEVDHVGEASSSQTSESIIQELEAVLVAERALRHEITLSRTAAVQNLRHVQNSWLQCWDQVVQQLHDLIPGFNIPPIPRL